MTDSFRKSVKNLCSVTYIEISTDNDDDFVDYIESGYSGTLHAFHYDEAKDKAWFPKKKKKNDYNRKQ
jgi:hypothetical protein